MTPTLRDLAFNACTALERASVELREGWSYEETLLGYASPIDELESVANALQDVSERVREAGGSLCESAANRLAKEAKHLLATRERLNEEAAQLLKDADEALQLQLEFESKPTRKTGT